MTNEDHESLEYMKYLLGNIGLEILTSIKRGAKHLETIKLFSGVSYNCIHGRLPVLLELNLIKKENDEYSLTEKGKKLYVKLMASR
ncbi:MAG: winged helix-turn-helix domain-containing protein [Promethearchaeota archaeon]